MTIIWAFLSHIYALLPAADAIKLQTASKLQGQTILGKLQFSTNEIALFCDEIKLLFCDEMKLYQDDFTAVFFKYCVKSASKIFNPLKNR